VFNQDGLELAKLDTYPGGGMLPTSQWRAGEVIADRYALRLPLTYTQPGNLWLDVSAWDFATKRFLPTFDGAGQPTGRQRYPVAGLAGARVAPQADPSRGFLEKARVAQASVVQDGARLRLSLDWLVTGDVTEPYTTFAHVFNAQGQKVAQGDAPPRLATRWWRAGDVIWDDTYPIDLPPALPPGAYTIRFGLYRPADGARMPAFDALGHPVNDAALAVDVQVK
jgi:hypothetical protein